MTDDACPVCGLRGEHQHRRHALEIKGKLDDGRVVSLRLDGCMACGETPVAAEAPCPSFIKTD